MRSCLLLIPVILVACKNDDEETPPDARSDQEIISEYLNIDLSNTENYSVIDYPVHYTEPVITVTNEPDSNLVTDKGAQLGRVLFYDVNLSINNTISCSSCHGQEKGFSDLAQFSVGFEGGLTGAHSMRLLNSKFYVAGSMFWDKRAESVEAQVVQPIQDHIEMGFDADHGGLEALLDKLRGLEYYPILFKEAFGSEEMNEERLAEALAQFVRSLSSTHSKFDEGFAQVFTLDEIDRGLSLNFPNFTLQENRGKDLFVSPKYPGAPTCGGCHRPPTFALALEARSNGLDEGETKVFKSPSLKSVARDGAFMHDGRFSTLEEVIQHYSTGVQTGPATDISLLQPNGNPHRLQLTDIEVDNLVAFLNTLTDEEIESDPKYSNPFK